MSFKINYLFEGNSRSKPEQNLSGSSKHFNRARDDFLQNAQEERRKRQEQRLKLESAEKLQSHIKSYLIRQHVKTEQRQIFDQCDVTVPLHTMLARCLFFYTSKVDHVRLLVTLIHIMKKEEEATSRVRDGDVRFCWLMKRFLTITLKVMKVNDENDLYLRNFYKFSADKNLLEYLMINGYYKELRRHLEISEGNMEEILELVHRPFLHITEDNNFSNSVLTEFSANFLRPALTPAVKNHLIPYLKKQFTDANFNKLVKFLNRSFTVESSNNIFYFILSIEPEDFEPTIDSIQFLSKYSKNIHQLSKPVVVHDADDDSDDEAMEPVNDADTILSDFVDIINASEKIKKWLNFLDCHSDNKDVLTYYIDWCHHLLLSIKDAVRKYTLLYQLGLNGELLHQLWKHMRINYADLLISRALYQHSWSECHTALSVFCSMFIFHIEIMTDQENSNTTNTFDKNDLCYMGKLLKPVAKEIIEVAFPMSRSTSVNPTSDFQYLYRVALFCLKQLYMLDLREQFCPADFWTQEKIFVSPDLAKTNYLSDTPLSSMRLYNQSRDGEDEHMPPLSTLEQRSLAVLEELPFLIRFDRRVVLLRQLCKNSVNDNDYQRLHNELVTGRATVIRRTHLYEDAFEKISAKSDTDIKYKIRIQFVNNLGLDEAGVDGGGIFKEFITGVLKTAFDPNRGFFLMTADNTLYPNPNVHLLIDNFTEHYFFIGRLLGKAIFENILVELPLAEFFLAKLLVERVSAHYLKSLDPVLYKNLLYLREFSGDISELGLDFTIVNNDLGETRVVELKPNGRNIPVTNENRLEYIQLLADFKLNIQLKKQIASFRDGLCSVIPLRWCHFFDHKELQVLIGGHNQEIDVEDFKSHTVYEGEFSENHPTILLFWKVFTSFTDPEKRQLLKFVTSCSRPPLFGFKELHPKFCIQSSGSENRMPTASTCLNLLKLPIIHEEFILRNKLLEAIEQQAGFELS